MTSRSIAALALLAACGSAGELHPFGSGQDGGGEGGGTAVAEGGDATAGVATGDETDGGMADDGTAGGTIDPEETPIVYVRCVRTRESLEATGEVTIDGAPQQASITLEHLDTYDTLPSVHRYRGGFVAPCDLVLRHGDGTEDILFACEGQTPTHGICAALDPAVSHDGRRVAFSVYRGAIEHDTQRVAARVLHPDAEEVTASFQELPNPQLVATEAQLHLVDVDTGEVTALPHELGVFDAAPAFLADGRLAFTSTRHGYVGALVRNPGEGFAVDDPEPLVSQLFVMDPAGRDIHPLSAHGLSGELYPFQLADGRIAHVAHDLLGMHPYRYNNGSPGTAGAKQGTFHLYALGPDGTLPTPLFGHHIHLSGPTTHIAAHRMGQSADGRLWFTEGAGPSGAGNLHGIAVRMDFVTGPGPDTAESLNDVFRPPAFELGFSWAGNGTGMSGPMPEPELVVEGYEDPIAHRGFVRDPDGMPGGGLVLSWTKGACHDIGTVHEELHGDADLPSGSAGFIAAYLVDQLGRDNPGCDAGIYRTSALPSEHPSDLEPIVDTVEYHELMPRAVVPYQAVHGLTAPAEDPAPAADEPSSVLDDRAQPFGTLLISSLLDRETRSISEHPFASEVAWALQGTDAGDYTDADVCGLRVLAAAPNTPDEGPVLLSPAGHRLSIVGEVAARKVDSTDAVIVDDSGEDDTSLAIAVPADVPLLLQAIDCDGRTLNTSQNPMSVRPGEVQRCHGCHRRSEPAIPIDATAMAEPPTPMLLGDGIVSLLAGGESTDVGVQTRDGWGWTVELETDVMPIFAARCMPCHDSETADAGLVLDVPGREPGSTWWQLVADSQQDYVPPERLAPMQTRLRKPQLSRYVRFMDARSSLLYWKAANERTDGRTDASFADDASGGFADVDFGPDHPTDITPEELGVLARWIDTAAGVGEAARRDTIAPTLAVAVDLDETQTLLRVGTVDVGEGIESSSLSVCLLSALGACDVLDAPDAALAGTVSVTIPSSDVEQEVRIEVADRAGNVTVVQRTIGTLAGADLASDAPSPGQDETEGTDDGTGGEGGAAGGDDGGGCSSGSRPRSPWWLVGLLLVTTARRGSQSTRRTRRRRPRAPARR